jgi:flavin-dependent dehydrogenase
MPFDADCDVLVVGAGLAGLAAARELAMLGHRVVIVDVKSAVDRSVHTTGIFVRRTLQDYGLPEDCLGGEVRRVVVHSPSGRRLELESARGEYRVGRMGRLYQRLLDEAIESGAEWLAGTRYRSCAPAPQGSAVWLERGGRSWRVRTRLVMGADGAVSRVARHLGLDENREWIVGVEDVLEGSACESAPEFHCYIDPELAPGYIGWVVDDGDQTHVGVGGYAARFDASEALQRLRDRLRGRYDLARLRRIERRGGRIPVNGIHSRIGNRQGMLVGDAAGAVSPLTAGGLDPCLRLTQLAVRIAGAYLDSGDARLLDAYTGRPFQRHFIKRRFLRRVLGAIQHRAVAEAVVLGLRGPLRPLAKRIFFGRGSFPDVALIQQGDARVRLAAGVERAPGSEWRELPVGD